METSYFKHVCLTSCLLISDAVEMSWIIYVVRVCVCECLRAKTNNKDYELRGCRLCVCLIAVTSVGQYDDRNKNYLF